MYAPGCGGLGGHGRILPSTVMQVLVFFQVCSFFFSSKQSVYICHPDSESLNSRVLFVLFCFALIWEYFQAIFIFRDAC